jgi:hypothetical protein
MHELGLTLIQVHALFEVNIFLWTTSRLHFYKEFKHTYLSVFGLNLKLDANSTGVINNNAHYNVLQNSKLVTLILCRADYLEDTNYNHLMTVKEQV